MTNDEAQVTNAPSDEAGGDVRRSDPKPPAGAHDTSPNPRRQALEVISRALSPTGKAFAQEILDDRLTRAGLKAEDRRLATELVFGVIRRLGTLDAVLAAYSERPLEELDPVVRQVLRIGLYQMLFLERIPAHAAVDESVRLARATGKTKATGFVNAVLRSIGRDLQFAPQPEAARPRNSFLLTSGRACVFGKAVLPPPADVPAWIGAAHSFPKLLVARWLGRYGATRARELCDIANEAPAIFARPNSVKTTAPELQETLRAEGVEAAPSPTGRTLRLPAGVQVAKLKAFSEGLFQVQDDSSAAVAEFVDPQPGETVLDLCAAPGGKTCHMAERMRRQGQIIAVDDSQRRLERVVENMKRLDLPIIATVEAEGALFAHQNRNRFHRVLLDAPCSNTGVLRRRVEARWRFSSQTLVDLVKQQRGLLDAALVTVKTGGALVYSTCSLEPEENGDVVRAVLRGKTDLRLDAEQQILPQRDGGDGIYMARIVRAAPA
jgi:16S rRNA (cytosine967-C5)-methyltransferase